jgi:hypothetical protein
MMLLTALDGAFRTLRDGPGSQRWLGAARRLHPSHRVLEHVLRFHGPTGHIATHGVQAHAGDMCGDLGCLPFLHVLGEREGETFAGEQDQGTTVPFHHRSRPRHAPLEVECGLQLEDRATAGVDDGQGHVRSVADIQAECHATGLRSRASDTAEAPHAEEDHGPEQQT